MAEGRMAEVVGKRNRADSTNVRQIVCPMSIEVLAELPYDCFGDLRHFERMCKPRAIEIAVSEIQDLSFSLQPSKGSRVHHPCIIDVSVVPCILGLRFPFLLPLTPNHPKFP